MIYIKAVHIIFVVTWFSGMFYLGRLLIYLREAQDRPEAERQVLQSQLSLMSRRLLYAITWPSAVLVLVSGLWLLTIYHTLPVWLWIKLALVLLLFLYHLSLHVLYGQASRGMYRYSSMQLRMWNEVPTVFLVAIVMLAVVKQSLSLAYGLAGLVVLVVLLLAGIRIYRRLR